MADSHYTYDIFISYSHSDGLWVRDWLLPRLESAGLYVCVDFRDFDIGVPILVNMERAVDNSRHTLLVLTQNWVDSEWSNFEALLTQTTDPAARQRRLLPLLQQPCRPSRRIAMLSYADFTQPEGWEAQLPRVVAAIRGELRMPEVGPLLGRLLRSEESPFTVPFMRNPDFFGREEDLARLHITLMGDQPVGIRPAGLTGMGGIGKTQLAVEYAYRYKDAYPGGVFWINAAESLAQGFVQLGRHLRPDLADRPLDEQAHAAADYLRSRPDALLILDNLADPMDLNRLVSMDLIPATLPCRVLFTTRRRDLGRFRAIEVTVLPEDAALQLLLRHPARRFILDPAHSEHMEARAICRALGWLPLALEVAGAFLGEWPDVSLVDFQTRLQQEGRLITLDEEATELSPASLPTIHEAAVAATLRTQWDALASDTARLLLRVAGQLPEAIAIPISRLGLLADVSDQGRPGHPSQLARTLKRLEGASLVEELQEGQVRLHPLVREFAAWQTPEEEVPAFRLWCAANLANAYEDIATLEEHCARRRVDALEEDLIAGINLLAPLSLKEKGASGEDVQARLQTLLRLLQRESHNLHDWGRTRRHSFSPLLSTLIDILERNRNSAFFIQQVHNRALDMGLTQLAVGAATRLAHLEEPYLALLWRARCESPELERTLDDHIGPVHAVVVTLDGRHVVSASSDCTLKVWNLQTGQVVSTLVGHTSGVWGVAITPDGRYIVSASLDQTLKVWDLQTGQAVRTLVGHTESVRAVAVTADGRYIVSASLDQTLKVWDLQTGQVVRTHAIYADEISVPLAVTPDGRRAISTASQHTLKVWNLLKGQTKRTLEHTNQSLVLAVAVTPNGRHAVSGSLGILKVWELRTGREIGRLRGHEHWVSSVAVTADGRYVVSASADRTLKVWDLQKRQELRTLAGHAAIVNAVAVSPDGRRAISASTDHTLKVWNLQARQGEHTRFGHTDSVNTVAITPDGRYAISGSNDHTLKVWDLQTGEVIHSLVGPLDEIHSVAVMSESRYVISASFVGKLSIWDLQTGEAVRTLEGHTPGGLLAVAVTPNGRYAISAWMDGILKVWDLRTNQEAYTLSGHTDVVRDVAVTSDSRYAISASMDSTLKVWDLRIGQAIYTFTDHEHWVNAVVAIRKGRCVISASSDGYLKVWNLRTGRVVRTFANPSGNVLAVAVNPDGNRAITASTDRTLRVWDLKIGQELAAITLEAVMKCVAVAPDGATIVAGDDAGNVYCLRYIEPLDNQQANI